MVYQSTQPINQSEAQLFETIATKLEGFSGREISKLMIAVQSAAYGSEFNALSERLLLTVVESKVDEHRRKIEMINEKMRDGGGWSAHAARNAQLTGAREELVARLARRYDEGYVDPSPVNDKSKTKKRSTNKYNFIKSHT